MEKRVNALRHLMEKEELDAFLVTSPYNLRYLTNFTGTTGLAVITKNNAYFVTDFRYTEQASKQCEGYQIVKNTGPIFEEILPLLKGDGARSVAFEESHITFAEYSQLQDLISMNGVDLVPVAGMIESLREVKDQTEIDTIQEACRITDAAFDHILGFIKPGMTEIQVANELDFYMRSLGATSVSFDTIVASGVRSAMPHGVASHKEIEQGDFVTIDFGCYYNGYVSDMTRTFSMGEPREQVLKEIYQIVLDAHLAVEKATRPGLTGKELDAVARDYITKHGYGEQFGHSTGHGIGLEIHEAPMISMRSDYTLVKGNTITDEPGIYLPGIGGVRIENDILLTDDGHMTFNKSPHELIIL